MEDKALTMTIKEFGKLWGIGEATMRKIVDDNPDFPCLTINKNTTKRRPRKLILVEEASQWIKRNLRQ